MKYFYIQLTLPTGKVICQHTTNSKMSKFIYFSRLIQMIEVYNISPCQYTKIEELKGGTIKVYANYGKRLIQIRRI